MKKQKNSPIMNCASSFMIKQHVKSFFSNKNTIVNDYYNNTNMFETLVYTCILATKIMSAKYNNTVYDVYN